MGLSETQIIIVLMALTLLVAVIALVVAVIAIFVAIFVPRYYHRKTSKRENKARTPLLVPYRFTIESLQDYHFWLKNHGQTEAKSIKINYEIEHLGEVIIPEKGFNISNYKTTLAPEEKSAPKINWTREERITDDYYGVINVRITYESDFSKPEPIEFPITIIRGEIKFPKVL